MKHWLVTLILVLVYNTSYDVYRTLWLKDKVETWANEHAWEIAQFWLSSHCPVPVELQPGLTVCPVPIGSTPQTTPSVESSPALQAPR